MSDSAHAHSREFPSAVQSGTAFAPPVVATDEATRNGRTGVLHFIRGGVRRRTANKRHRPVLAGMQFVNQREQFRSPHQREAGEESKDDEDENVERNLKIHGKPLPPLSRAGLHCFTSNLSPCSIA